MEEKFSNIWQAWHNYLVAWTRDRAPKLLVILVLAFILVRLLGLITRKIVALSEKTPAHGAVRSQQVRTVIGVVRSVGVFLIVFVAGMTLLKDVFLINIEPLLASAGIAGLAIGANMMHIPPRWIGVGVLVLAGIGITTAVTSTRNRDPS